MCEAESGADIVFPAVPWAGDDVPDDGSGGEIPVLVLATVFDGVKPAVAVVEYGDVACEDFEAFVAHPFHLVGRRELDKLRIRHGYSFHWQAFTACSKLRSALSDAMIGANGPVLRLFCRNREISIPFGAVSAPPHGVPAGWQAWAWRAMTDGLK